MANKPLESLSLTVDGGLLFQNTLLRAIKVVIFLYVTTIRSIRVIKILNKSMLT